MFSESVGFMRDGRRQRPQGFTLIELLVVIAIVALLLAILMPALSGAKSKGLRVRCLSNQRQLGVAIYTYASSSAGYIPYGPSKAPPFTATNFYPIPGSVTSLISLQGGAAVGLGLMLEDQLARNKRVLFCPGADQNSLAEEQLANVGIRQAQCDYYYRHASGGSIYEDPGTGHLKLSRLGTNSRGMPIRALVMDVNFLCDSSLAVFGVNSRTSHGRQTLNMLYSDGHSEVLDNRSGAFTVDARAGVSNSFARILAVFETGDAR
jgi:prepilin-type N-terminal cleavage/methylation domain-containing protein/prepilin-type processing-associated H-X9-DG protein